MKLSNRPFLKGQKFECRVSTSPWSSISAECSRITTRLAAVLRWDWAGAGDIDDPMSGGRVELGLGAGWWEREHAATGIELPGNH